jgi:dipeptidyl aminopeptidase/acylaminoacyl peptidase
MPRTHSRHLHLLISATLCLLSGALAFAQEAYRQPPPEITRILDAPRLPAAVASPDGSVLLLLQRDNLPPISELARPMLRLAGRRIDPERNAPHGPRAYSGLFIKRIADLVETPVAFPDGAGLGFPRWSPDGQRCAITVTRDNGVELWVVNLANASARALTGPVVNTLGPRPVWTPDGKSILVPLVVAGRGPAPERPRVPTGPVIQQNLGGKPAPVRTFQDLLEDQVSENQFDYYFTSQLALIDANTGAATPLGAPAIFTNADPSPDGRYILVERILRPYSYLVPMDDFPQSVEVWSIDGAPVRTLAKLPLADRVPIEGVITGPRSHQWRDTESTAQIVWAEALDEGDPKNKVDHRDRLMALNAPFTGEPSEVYRTEHRFMGLSYFEQSSLATIAEYDRDRRWIRAWIVDFDGKSEPRLFMDRSRNDRYADPGTPVETLNKAGRSVIRLENGIFFLSGRGATPEGDRPFLDRVDLATLNKTRMWRNEGEFYESVVDLLAADGTKILITRESPTVPPNYFVVSNDGGLPPIIKDLLNSKSAQSRAITNFPHPAPELLGITKKLVKYKREDGVDLSATLYLPADYREGDRLPLIVWAYPLEYNDPYTAGQVSGSPNRFTMFNGSSHLFLLTQGYAIMDNAAMPVVGDDPEVVNDTFIQQVVASAKAAIEHASSLGVADSDRVGVGGHSYGAFMTANLLAHCDLFRAGVARSGAYNRTLTPFGFQGERRTLWEAPEIYANLSPFMHADKINEPLLLIHGQLDNNPGTFPMQSERLYHAIKGNGGVVRLVELPEESHGYRARESIGHVLAEMVDWFDTYVKHAATSAEPSSN